MSDTKTPFEDAIDVVQLAGRGLTLIERVTRSIREAVHRRDPHRLQAIEDALVSPHAEADVQTEIDAARERLKGG